MTYKIHQIPTNQTLNENRDLLVIADGKDETITNQQNLLHEHGIAPRWENWKNLLLAIYWDHPSLMEDVDSSTMGRLGARLHEAGWRTSFAKKFSTLYPLPTPIPRVVKASNLALRFYVADGWYLEELNPLLVRGFINCGYPNDIEPYFSLQMGGCLDVDALLLRTSVLNRPFEQDLTVSDRQYMIEKMW